MLGTRIAAAAAVALLMSLLSASTTSARITEVRTDLIEIFADDAKFGTVGPYVRIGGVAKGELDPKAPENAVIVNLDKAPTNARGMVTYETDFFILRPIDPLKGNGILFYDVNNRGLKLLLPAIQDAPSQTGSINDPKTLQDAGSAFLLERGYSIVWSGWDPNPSPAAGSLATRVPVAMENGKPIVRRIREEFQVGTRGPADVAVARLNYPAATRDKTDARLTVRDRESDARTEISAAGWEFVDDKSIRLLPEGTKFGATKIYELWYEATNPNVVGIGYAATRDLVAYLRHDRGDPAGNINPLISTDQSALQGTGIRHAVAFGISQSGRYLRHHIELGMNRDEQGRRVFDGVLAHISGIGKVFANHPFAEPGRTATQHEDRYYPENWFPFSTASTTDPFSARTASLLRGDASDPLLIETNTSTEYWQKGASLLHIDPAGKTDLELPASVRVFLIAGNQHSSRSGAGATPGPCANPRNPNNAGPVLRALIVALEDWVTKGVAPPASRVPSIAQETAVEASMVKMPAVKNFVLAPGDNRIGPAVDWNGPPGSAEKAYLASSGPQLYGTRVSAVDADGNELAGIRLPAITVPVATYTGWNVYKVQPMELCDREGSYVPFAKTRAEREAAGDPRPSIEERYGSREAYVAKVRAAADALVRDRLLLPADAAAYVRAAEASDRF